MSTVLSAVIEVLMTWATMPQAGYAGIMQSTTANEAEHREAACFQAYADKHKQELPFQGISVWHEHSLVQMSIALL